MYDKLAKRLRSEAIYLPEKFSKNAELFDVLMKSADAIEELRKMYQWVPVTERLPKIDKKYLCSKDVLVRLKDGVYCFSALQEHGSGQVSFECERNGETVTHWMPLPEPPEKEKT